MLKPFIKWAGGKQQLLPIIKNKLPKSYNRYIEPFLGSGALLLYLEPIVAIINDTNEALINLYTQVRDNPNELIDAVSMLDKALKESYNPKEYYLIIRDEFNRQLSTFQNDLNSAAHFLFINKHCFNGLYRVNSKNEFNVPYGKKEKVNTYEGQNLGIICGFLNYNDIKILSIDFEEAVKEAKKGDFIYFDPPYDVFPDKNGFVDYGKDGFNKDEQVRLRDCFRELSDRGVFVMLSNHNTPFINEIYAGFNIHVIDAKRMINSDPNGRGNVQEVIITNY